jgi:hypothetical protein
MEMLVRNRKTAQESSTGKNIEQNKKEPFLSATIRTSLLQYT